MSMPQRGNGEIPQGAVLLGGRKLSVTISPAHAQKLEILAATNKTGMHSAAEALLMRVIDTAFAQLQASKFIHECSQWLMWPYAKVG